MELACLENEVAEAWRRLALGHLGPLTVRASGRAPLAAATTQGMRPRPNECRTSVIRRFMSMSLPWAVMFRGCRPCSRPRYVHARGPSKEVRRRRLQSDGSGSESPSLRAQARTTCFSSGNSLASLASRCTVRGRSRSLAASSLACKARSGRAARRVEAEAREDCSWKPLAVEFQAEWIRGLCTESLCTCQCQLCCAMLLSRTHLMLCCFRTSSTAVARRPIDVQTVQSVWVPVFLEFPC